MDKSDRYIYLGEMWNAHTHSAQTPYKVHVYSYTKRSNSYMYAVR